MDFLLLFIRCLNIVSSFFQWTSSWFETETIAALNVQGDNVCNYHERELHVRALPLH